MVQKLEGDQLCQLLLCIFLYTPGVYKQEFKMYILILRLELLEIEYELFSLMIVQIIFQRD